MSFKFKHLRVLVMDENHQMLELIKSVLVSFGMDKIFLATHTDQAFRLYCKERPDLVITNWNIETLSGLELTRKIRNSPTSPNQYIPIIAMTNITEKKLVLNARDTGITEFLRKPFNARDLYKRIERMLENPKKFVRSENFFGPDRRRKKKRAQYAGPLRRKHDIMDESTLYTPQNQHMNTDQHA